MSSRVLTAFILLLLGTYFLFGPVMVGLLALLVAALFFQNRTHPDLWGLRVTAFLFLLGLASQARAILLPFVSGFFLGFLLNPVVSRLERFRIPRWLSTLVMLLGGMAFFTVMAVLLGYQIVGELSHIIQRLQTQSFPFSRWLDRLPVQINLEAATQAILTAALNLVKGFLSNLSSLGVGLGVAVRTFFFTFLTLLVAFYVSLDYDRVEASIDRIFQEHFPGMREFMDEFMLLMRRYFRGQLTLALILGTFVGTALELLGVRSGILIGALVASTNLIPNLGFWISILPALFFGAMEPSPVAGLLKVSVVFGANQMLEAVISPRILGGSVHLHPLLVLLALLLGGKFLGFLGMLLAVPVAATLMIFARRLVSLFGAPDNSAHEA
jgi:predicted PurR-regulated permease PerM